jgi:hypothetical protein
MQEGSQQSGTKALLRIITMVHSADQNAAASHGETSIGLQAKVQKYIMIPAYFTEGLAKQCPCLTLETVKVQLLESQFAVTTCLAYVAPHFPSRPRCAGRVDSNMEARLRPCDNVQANQICYASEPIAASLGRPCCQEYGRSGPWLMLCNAIKPINWSTSRFWHGKMHMSSRRLV